MSHDALSVGTPGHQAHLTEQLKRNEEIFRLLVSSVKDYAIFMLDSGGHVVTWNEGAQRINGYTADEITGKHFSIFYTEEAKSSRHPQKELKDAIANGRYEEEGWRVRKDGTTFWSSVVITPLYEQERLVGFAKVTRDLTERKIAEDQREENARRIAEANEELQRLAYIVSHELQAPISTISRYCRLLTVRYHDRLGEDANDFIRKISESARLVGRMVDDLWTYARVSKFAELREMVNTNNAVKDAVADLSELFYDKELTVGELPTIHINREQFTYVLRELVLNAVRYRRDVPLRIHINANREGDGWLFSVEDNGIGIQSVSSDEVFKLFHRLHGNIEADATGTGLAMCRNIVQQHGGRIWFESRVGEGTTFYVWLPELRR